VGRCVDKQANITTAIDAVAGLADMTKDDMIKRIRRATPEVTAIYGVDDEICTSKEHPDDQGRVFGDADSVSFQPIWQGLLTC
jgi:hypothetical protein